MKTLSAARCELSSQKDRTPAVVSRPAKDEWDVPLWALVAKTRTNGWSGGKREQRFTSGGKP